MRVKSKALIFIAALFAVIAAFFAMPAVRVTVSHADVPTVAQELYYGRSKLTGAHIDAYDAISAGVGNKSAEISLEAYNLSNDDFEKIYELYRNDHVEHYWIPNLYSLEKMSSKITKLKLSYLTGFNDAVFNNKAAEYLALTDGLTSEYDKALVLHDALVKNVKYVTSATNAHNCYGAIVGGQAVCEGYAEAYQYLLQRVGIMSYIVTGTSHGEGHEWNVVRLDNKFYYTDVTWDDPVAADPDKEARKPVYHAYFNITKARLDEDHVANDDYSILPPCTNDDKMYAGMKQLAAYSVNAVAEAITFVGNIGTADLYYTGDLSAENFSQWFSDNINAVVAQTVISGRGGGSVTAMSCGRERIIRIEGPIVHATAVSLDKSALSVVAGHTKQLTATVTPSDYCSDIVVWSSSDASVATVSDSGKVKAVGVGTATITATAGSVSAACTVTVIDDCSHAHKTPHAAVASTCTERGNSAYLECDVCGMLFDGDGNTLSDIPFLELVPHAYGELVPGVAKTCTTDGAKAYRHCSMCNKNYDEDGNELDSIVIPAGHSYGTPEWTWSVGLTSASVKLVCTACGHEETAEATITKNTIKEPTVSAEGEAVFTATATVDGEVYTDKKDAKLPKLEKTDFFSSLIQKCSFGGVIDGRLGLGLIVGGIVLFVVLMIVMIHSLMKKSKTKNKRKRR